VSELLLCGGTGDLGGRIAVRLAARGIPFRALVRPRSDTTALRSSGAELSVGASAPGPAQPWVPVAVESRSANLRWASSRASTALPRRSQPRVSADLSGARAS
jgi:uncharacterized protein YbjT (DUF2867 family)